MHPRHLSIDQFDYELPDERVAKYPLPERDSSKLLFCHPGGIVDHTFTQLPNLLPEDTLLVFNNSKVVEARLLFQKPTGGQIEIFALEPATGSMELAMNARGHLVYRCMVGGANKWKDGQLLQKHTSINGAPLTITAELLKRGRDAFEIGFRWVPEQIPFVQVLHAAGQLPIPPYLHRATEPSDEERYQTIYAAISGSVAAPTAGLHFTPQVLQALDQRGIGQAFTTLHVGAGTFLPVKTETMAGHHMHEELLEVTHELLDQLMVAKRVIPVGTTAMRTLESIYRMGEKLLASPDLTPDELAVKQWDAYEDGPKQPEASEALMALKRWMEAGGLKTLVTKTGILIAPGYQFGICSGLVTNFHQPRSTLLLLVAALIGEDWKRVYAHALENDYRFLSYGDSSLLLP